MYAWNEVTENLLNGEWSETVKVPERVLDFPSKHHRYDFQWISGQVLIVVLLLNLAVSKLGG